MAEAKDEVSESLALVLLYGAWMAPGNLAGAGEKTALSAPDAFLSPKVAISIPALVIA